MKRLGDLGSRKVPKAPANKMPIQPFIVSLEGEESCEFERITITMVVKHLRFMGILFLSSHDHL